MAIRIGHAAKDENGNYKGGAAGDQTGKEVYIRSWYNRPWNYVIRAKDSDVANNIALAMERACGNSKIGYDQNQRNSLLTRARKVGYDPGKVTEACETDCSALVSLCCMYAGIPESSLFISNNSATTSTLRSRLTKTGKFSVYTAQKYVKDDNYLKRGDILLYEGHHVAVALDNGSSVVVESTVDTSTPITAASYTKTQFIKDVQRACGAKVDGIAGPDTLGHTVTVSAKKNQKHPVVLALQKRFVALGYKTVGTCDGVAGSKFDTTAKKYQRDYLDMMNPDGEFTAGGRSWRVILGIDK